MVLTAEERKEPNRRGRYGKGGRIGMVLTAEEMNLTGEVSTGEGVGKVRYLLTAEERNLTGEVGWVQERRSDTVRYGSYGRRKEPNSVGIAPQ